MPRILSDEAAKRLVEEQGITYAQGEFRRTADIAISDAIADKIDQDIDRINDKYKARLAVLRLFKFRHKE